MKLNLEILKHPSLPFDVIVRDGDAQVRYKQTGAMEPANPQVVLMALLIKELTSVQLPQSTPAEVIPEITPKATK